MKALIDADWFAYAFGNATDAEYKILAWPFVKSRIDGTIRGIIEATKATSHQLYITSSDKSNFRFKIATIKPYKGNRPSSKPFYYDKIREYLVQGKCAIEVFGMEADDAVSIEQCKAIATLGDKPKSSDNFTTVICSIDKDLDMVEGLHYNWMKEDDGVYWIEPITGLQKFYCQLLTGDTVDNIPGLYGVGKSSSFIKSVCSLYTEQEMYNLVQIEYEKRFGSYYYQFLIENGQLLWMLRGDQGDLKGQEVVERFSKLEAERLENLEKEKEKELIQV